MKRSGINAVVQSATTFFNANGWALPPNPAWDVTDFGLGSFSEFGLVLVNLAEEKEYCEKLMYAVANQITPIHAHKKKKEDIICRTGILNIQLWTQDPKVDPTEAVFETKVSGKIQSVKSGEIMQLKAGERVTIVPGIWHCFYPGSPECIIGEVSTANDDLNDNFFSDERIGRFSDIEEDEPAIVKLVSDK
jgi:hypothetical protein